MNKNLFLRLLIVIAIFAVALYYSLVKPIKLGLDLKGGGRPDFAQAGGKDEGKLLDAFKEVREIIEAKLV